MAIRSFSRVLAGAARGLETWRVFTPARSLNPALHPPKRVPMHTLTITMSNVSQSPAHTGRRIGVSSWSLHRLLGAPAMYDTQTPLDAVPLGAAHWRDALLALPAQLAAHNIHTLQICHFHLRDLSPAYLAELRAELTRHNIELHALLIDSGDITHPTQGMHDVKWVMDWVPVAAALGAANIRAIAGKQPHAPEAMAASRFGLNAIADRADEHGVGTLIENWFALLPTGAAVNALLDATDGMVQLNIDFGNFPSDKYTQLAACAEHAVSCHAKGNFSAPLQLDTTDYAQCLSILEAAQFDGPYCLIYDDAGSADEWAGLAAERALIHGL